MKVLLVDDSKILRRAIEMMLVKAGHEVCTAADGEEALKTAREEQPEAILLDMMLPGMTGPEVLKALKADPRTVEIPVIVSSSLSQKNEQKLMEDGAAGFLEKTALMLDQGATTLVEAMEAILHKHA